MTEVTPPLENTRFSPFFDFTVLRPPGNAGGGLFLYAVYRSAAAVFALRQLARSTGMSAVSAMSSLRE